MKTYIKPISKSIKVETENLLAESNISVLSAGDGGDALSKKHSLHGDEWDFDGEEGY